MPHTLDKMADTFLDVLVFHSDALPPVNRNLSITIYAWEYKGRFNILGISPQTDGIINLTFKHFLRSLIFISKYHNKLQIINN